MKPAPNHLDAVCLPSGLLVLEVCRMEFPFERPTTEEKTCKLLITFEFQNTAHTWTGVYNLGDRSEGNCPVTLSLEALPYDKSLPAIVTIKLADERGTTHSRNIEVSVFEYGDERARHVI